MANLKRIESLDFFRGITIAAMILVNNPGSWSNVYAPLLHAKWHGWTPTDFIFPFFLFMIGVSITLSMTNLKARNDPKKEVYKRIIRRTLILFGLGLFLSGFPYYDLSVIRIFGVLQRIAICYLISTIIFLHTSTKLQIYWTLGFLLIYWALMEFIPVPEIGAGMYEAGANFSNYIDSILLKGHVWSGTKTWDPEGIISTIPAISTTLFGVLTGHLIMSKKEPFEKTTLMLVAGNILIMVGLVWSQWLPINKSLWTSSYAVFSSGMGMVTLGISYWLIDIKKWKFGVKPFVAYGLNAITVFVFSGIIGRLLYLIKWESSTGNEITLKNWIFETFLLSWLSPINASLSFAIGFIIVSYLLVYVLYKRKIFIKI